MARPLALHGALERTDPNRTHSISQGSNTRRHLFTRLTRYLQEHLPVGAR